MVQRIISNRNPDFFFMSYSREEMKVMDFMLIPKYFFIPDIIEKRKPLSKTARRAGWIGCNIMIERIPKQGRIEIISNGNIHRVNDIIGKVCQGNALKTDNIVARGWLLDILSYVNIMPNNIFTLNEIYTFEKQLSLKHPKNRNIKAKIRQQLQILRDKGFIEFSGEGKYRKI